MNPPPPPPPPSAPAQKKSRLWLILGVVFAVLVVLVGAAVVVGGKLVAKAVATQKERRAKLAEIDKMRRDIAEETRASIEEGKIDGGTERLSKYSESLASAAEGLSGYDKKALLIGQRMLELMKPPLRNYEAALKELQEANILAVETIDSREAIAGRVAVVRKFNTANDELKKVFKGYEAQFREELKKEGFPEKEHQKFLTAFTQNANLELLLEIRDCDTEFAGALDKILGLLDREWGGWKVDNGLVSFTKEPVSEEYNTLIEQVQTIGERQTTAQQELLNRASKQRPLR